MRLKRLTYLPKATRLVGGRILSESIAWCLIIQLLTTFLAPYCFKVEREPWRSVSCSLQIHCSLPWKMTGWRHQQDTAPSSSLLGCGDGEFRQVNGEKKEPREFIPKFILGQLYPYLFLSSISLMPSWLRGDNMCFNSPRRCTVSGFLIPLPIDW